MGCAYSADRKIDVVTARIQPIDNDIRQNGDGIKPKYVNNLRGISIKGLYPKDDIIPGFT
jgi:hypothetical protein